MWLLPDGALTRSYGLTLANAESLDGANKAGILIRSFAELIRFRTHPALHCSFDDGAELVPEAD